MTPAEIEHSALHGDELPDKLTAPEQCLFLSLRQLYRGFHAGSIDRNQAHREKQHILSRFSEFQCEQKLYAETVRMRNRLARYYTEIEKSGDEYAIQMLKIWDGRDRPAESEDSPKNETDK